MNWLHVNALVRDVQEAVDAHQRHNVFYLDLFAARYHALLAQLLQPCFVELVINGMLRKDVVFENQLVQVVLVRLAPLLVQHVDVPQGVEEFGHIVELDINLYVKLLFSVHFFQALHEILRIVYYIWFRYLRVYRHLDNSIRQDRKRHRRRIFSIEVHIELRLS